MKRFELSMLLGLVAAVVLGSNVSFARECEQIRESVLRLHILANSDTQEDQRIKLQVRDAILEHTDEIFDQPHSLKEAESAAKENLGQVEEIAKQTLRELGRSDGVRAQVVNMFFDTRHYEGFDLPAGRYDAIRVSIGAGEGHNWWCVVFPPMCITVAQPSSQPVQQQILSLGDTPAYRPKLAVVELVQTLEERLRRARGEPADCAAKQWQESPNFVCIE